MSIAHWFGQSQGGCGCKVQADKVQTHSHKNSFWYLSHPHGVNWIELYTKTESSQSKQKIDILWRKNYTVGTKHFTNVIL